MKPDERKTKGLLPVQPHTSIPEDFQLVTYTYDLPPELIAQEPARVRDQSRLLALYRNTGEIRHHRFRDLPSLLLPSDLLVINETRVTPAFLIGHKPTGGRVELLVLDPTTTGINVGQESSAIRPCLVRTRKPLRQGAAIRLENGTEITVVESVGPGRVLVRFPVPDAEFLSFLNLCGQPPLPPYIRREERGDEYDRERYQTIYAKVAGSVAAPTAGLHFTKELIEELEKKGITIARIHLQVGPGTFIPVREEDIRLHQMESEFYEISEDAADSIARACREGRRIIAVGTTTVRALESAATPEGGVQPGRGETRLFIVPGYSFKVVSGLVTNFHLPGSTLLMLVSAFGGTDRVKNAYRAAVREKYHFYSYGDACLVVD